MKITGKSSFIAVSALILTLFSIYLIYSASTVFFQLFMALALAYILSPAVDRLERLGLYRIPSILLVFISALVATVFALWSFFASINAELSGISLNIPRYAQHLYEIMPAGAKESLGIETDEKLAWRLTEMAGRLRADAPSLLKPAFIFLKGAFSSTINLVLTMLGYFIIPVYLFYFLIDLKKLKFFMLSMIPERYRNICETKALEIDAILSGFIRGQLLVCAILAMLYSVGLYFIGIDLAIAIGTLAGIMFIIPYAGTVAGILLSIVMAILKFQDMLHPLLCLGWFAIVQLAEGFIITPKIVGDKIGLHPLAALIALLAGGQVFGLAGMLLALPAAAVIQVFLRTLVESYRESDFFLGEK